jgi:hypothetical protein
LAKHHDPADDQWHLLICERSFPLLPNIQMQKAGAWRLIIPMRFCPLLIWSVRQPFASEVNSVGSTS